MKKLSIIVLGLVLGLGMANGALAQPGTLAVYSQVPELIKPAMLRAFKSGVAQGCAEMCIIFATEIDLREDVYPLKNAQLLP